MKRKLSSDSLTIFWKFLFPALWIILFGSVSILFAVLNNPETKFLMWVFLLVGLVGAVALLRLASQVKFVSVDDRFLYVSSGAKEIQVPLAEVESIDEGGSSSEPGQISIKYITLRLKTPSEFGEKVVFVPKMHWTFLSTSHPVAEELRAMIKGIREPEVA
jgi:hypothetical protein